MIIGIDFDNTLIRYDGLFHKVALERGHIPATLPQEKNAVRDYLREQGKEEVWTAMQGEVYGRRILEADPFPGMLEVVSGLKTIATALYIISHKTKRPYLGPPYDLHAAARSWLSAKGFFDPLVLGWNSSHVFFEETKEAKVQRIISLGCTHYIDDLPEILEMVPETIVKLHFCPGTTVPDSRWASLPAWEMLPSLLKNLVC